MAYAILGYLPGYFPIKSPSKPIRAGEAIGNKTIIYFPRDEKFQKYFLFYNKNLTQGNNVYILPQ